MMSDLNCYMKLSPALLGVYLVGILTQDSQVIELGLDVYWDGLNQCNIDNNSLLGNATPLDSILSNTSNYIE